MKSTVSARASENLEAMLRDQPAEPTPFWARAVPQILEDIDLYGIENFYAHPSAQAFYADALPEPVLRRHYNILKRVDPHHTYSQSDVGRPYQRVEYGGRYYTATSLRYLRGLAFLKQHADVDAMEDLLEVGGGFGCLGDIFLKASPSHFYIDVDIPPVAAIATYTLETLYGEGAVLDYLTSREMETIDLSKLRHQYRAAVLCPWQLSRVTGRVDLAVNFISFQEMEPETVASYADQIKRLCRGPILLRNSDRGKPGTDHPVTRSHYLELFSPWTLAASDIDTYGDTHPTHHSEVMVLTPPTP